MDGFKLNKYINIVDLVVISYLIDTLVLCFFIPDSANKMQPVLFRLVSFIAIGFIIFHNIKENNKITSAIRFFYPIVLLSYIYGETALFNSVFFRTSFDSYLVNWDFALFGCQPALIFHKKFNSIFFSELMNFSYFSYYLFVIGFAFLAFRSSAEKRRKNIFVIINSFIIYYAIFIVIPTYGPQFYFPNESIEMRKGIFSTIIHWIQLFGEAPTGAFPSSHVGMMFVFLFIAFKDYRKAIPITIIFTLLIIPATVYIKAHYVVDIIAGIISAPILYFISNQMFKFYNKVLEEL